LEAHSGDSNHSKQDRRADRDRYLRSRYTEGSGGLVTAARDFLQGLEIVLSAVISLNTIGNAGQKRITLLSITKKPPLFIFFISHNWKAQVHILLFKLGAQKSHAHRKKTLVV